MIFCAGSIAVRSARGRHHSFSWSKYSHSRHAAAVVHLGVSAVIQTAILILFVAITSRLFQMLASRIVGQVRGQAP
jgi:hypothetical protein